MLFLASIKNDTEIFFINYRKLKDVKTSLINSKIYGLLGMIDLKKLIIGMKLWDNLCGHLCFPFMTLTLNDLLNFSINLIDDNNKQIESI